jgi:hypothetical protein
LYCIVLASGKSLIDVSNRTKYSNMKRSKMFKLKFLTGVIVVLSAMTLSAQSVVSERTAKAEESLEKYDIKVGGIFTDASYKMTLGYDDNTTSSSGASARDEGAYLINGLNLDFYVPINEEFSIETGFFIGYKNWLSGKTSDALVVNVTSGDSFAFDWRINESTTISLVDRLKINVSSVEDGNDNEGVDDVRMLDNDLGLQFFQQIDDTNRYGFKTGINIVRSMNNDFTVRERDDFYIGAEYSHDFSGKLTLTPYTFYKTYDFKEDGNNDADEWETGMALKYAATEQFSILLTLAWQTLDFDGTLEDKESSGLIGSLLLSHTISETMNQSVFIKHGNRVSISESTNFSADWLIDYSFNWQVSEDLSVTPKVSWFISEDQTTDGEQYDILTPGISISYKISEKMLLGVDYSYSEKASNTQSEYDKTVLSMSLTYDF